MNQYRFVAKNIRTGQLESGKIDAVNMQAAINAVKVFMNDGLDPRDRVLVTAQKVN